MSTPPAAWADAPNHQDDPLLVVLDEAGILDAATELFAGGDPGPAVTAADVRAHLATIRPLTAPVPTAGSPDAAGA